MYIYSAIFTSILRYKIKVGGSPQAGGQFVLVIMVMTIIKSSMIMSMAMKTKIRNRKPFNENLRMFRVVRIGIQISLINSV